MPGLPIVAWMEFGYNITSSQLRPCDSNNAAPDKAAK
jgi:hypothetical protein